MFTVHILPQRQHSVAVWPSPRDTGIWNLCSSHCEKFPVHCTSFKVSFIFSEFAGFHFTHTAGLVMEIIICTDKAWQQMKENA